MNKVVDTSTTTCIFMIEKFTILFIISLRFVSKGAVDNKSALVHVVAWRWNMAVDIIWTNADPGHWRKYAALEGGECFYQ